MFINNNILVPVPSSTHVARAYDCKGYKNIFPFAHTHVFTINSEIKAITKQFPAIH